MRVFTCPGQPPDYVVWGRVVTGVPVRCPRPRTQGTPVIAHLNTREVTVNSDAGVSERACFLRWLLSCWFYIRVLSYDDRILGDLHMFQIVLDLYL